MICRLRVSESLSNRTLPLLAAGIASICVCLPGVGFMAQSAEAASASQGMTLYSIAKSEQYVNNADDRARGKGNNPFGNFRDATATATHQSGAPFPGDEAIYAFDVYANDGLKKSVGTAVYTCQYNFNKNAWCDAVYEINGGTLFGSGAFNFNADTFALGITGGLGKYSGVTGGIRSMPGPSHSQRLIFTLG